MRIYVITNAFNNIVELQAEPQDLVQQLKSQLASEHHIAPEHLASLTYVGRPLDDSQTLRKYHIEDTSLLYLAGGGAGGSRAATSHARESPQSTTSAASSSSRSATSAAHSTTEGSSALNRNSSSSSSSSATRLY